MKNKKIEIWLVDRILRPHVFKSSAKKAMYEFQLWLTLSTQAATGGVLYKKVLSEILQNLQGNTCARDSFFNKVAGLRP